MFTPEKQAQVDEARTGLAKLPKKSVEDLRKFWEANMVLGHRTLGKILLGRTLKGETDSK